MDPYQDLFDTTGNIRQDKIEDLLVEVVSGKNIFPSSRNATDLYASKYPDAAEQDQARIVYVKRLKEIIAKGVQTKPQLERFAIDHELFVPGERDEKMSLLKMLERQRSAKEKTTDVTHRSRLTVEMEITRKRIIDIELREFEIMQHSAEVRAEDARVSYYVSCCTLGGEMLDTPVWESWQDFQSCADWLLIQDARQAFTRVMNGLPLHVIRAIALTPEWRIRWKTAKESGASPFRGHGFDWDRNKVHLIYWSDFYDNIYQHPECPDEQTVRDEEALQRWLNQQIAKRKQQQGNLPTLNNRAAPTYIANGQRRQMTKIGGDKVVQVNTPYKVRT